MYKILFHFQKNNRKITVEYDESRYDHNAWQDSKYIGRIRLREFFFNGWDCVNKEFIGE